MFRRSRSRARARGAGGGAFTPLRVAGLAAWFRPDLASTITLNGSNVSQANDQSGNARHAVQATGALQPSYVTGVQNGRAVIRYQDAARTLLSTFGATLSQPNTLYCVAKTGVGAPGFILDGRVDGVRHAVYAVSGTQARIFAGTTEVSGAFNTTTAFHIYAAVFNGASSALYADGSGTAVLSGNPGAQALDGLTLGNTRGGGAASMLGDLGEVLVYAGAHDAATRAKIFAYLNAGWACY